MLDKAIFPHIHLLVSGGNTQLILCKSITDWKVIGATLDDAAGECFDKISRMIGLPYPSGLYLAKIAKMHDRNYFNLPISMQGNKNLSYSFSGLKTAVRNLVQKNSPKDLVFMNDLSTTEIKELIDAESILELKSSKLAYIYSLSISVQSVIVDQLLSKLKLVIEIQRPASIGLSGGVSANLLLRAKVKLVANNNNLPVYIPHPSLTGDNAIMIGLSGIASFEKSLK